MSGCLIIIQTDDVAADIYLTAEKFCGLLSINNNMVVGICINLEILR